MDRWMGGARIWEGNSQGHRPIALFSCSPYQHRFLNSGLADPRDLGSCVVELVTPQLMVGSFRHPAHHPPRVPTGTRGGREGGIYYCTRNLSRCLTCSTAPQVRVRVTELVEPVFVL